MKTRRLTFAVAYLAIPLALLTGIIRAGASPLKSNKVTHVLLLRIDGMHAVDLYNCVHGLEGVNDGAPYCPNLAALRQHAIIT